MTRRSTFALGLALGSALLASQPGFSAPDAEVTLFKVVTVKDEVVIGLTKEQLDTVYGHDAPGIARMLATNGSLDAWRYAVAKGATGDLVNVPLARVGLLRDGLVRIEPMTTPLPIVPPRAQAR